MEEKQAFQVQRATLVNNEDSACNLAPAQLLGNRRMLRYLILVMFALGVAAGFGGIKSQTVRAHHISKRRLVIYENRTIAGHHYAF